ncbi:hypothetical protein HFP89_09265 [Wenzhouxiangella sp. XN79A]|uniref:hypothetical protein n=1 Tax=Wenzhouxiangella sp. XN79A TaxID=2724193 RepID=UPI00144AE48D|nr:hypothetical protein [Wenzhouxiangella sp. XN79A]NKI35356.1 hypothetical protein [Wenzhouxiangella sp. XN79A]
MDLERSADQLDALTELGPAHLLLTLTRMAFVCEEGELCTAKGKTFAKLDRSLGRGLVQRVRLEDQPELTRRGLVTEFLGSSVPAEQFDPELKNYFETRAEVLSMNNKSATILLSTVEKNVSGAEWYAPAASDVVMELEILSADESRPEAEYVAEIKRIYPRE